MSWQGFPQGTTDMPTLENEHGNSIMPSDFLMPSSAASLNAAIPMDLLNNSNGVNFSMNDGAMNSMLPNGPSWMSEEMFPSSGTFAMPLAFNANDLHRSSSQPANRRRGMDSGNWDVGQQSRDTLYAHEFLKAFRARLPNSSEGQAACDYCRKRKIKCDRKKPTCGHCEQSGRVCTSDDILRKRGPPSKRERAMMDNAGIVFRKRNARAPKHQNRHVSNDRSSEENPTPSFTLANDRFDLAMASMGSNNGADAAPKTFKDGQWLLGQSMWGSMASLPSSMPSSERVNIPAPSSDTGVSQSGTAMNQSTGIRGSMFPPALNESNLWMSNNPFSNAPNPMLGVNETAGTSSLSGVMPSSNPGSLNPIVDQNFVNLGEGRGVTPFDSTSQANPDLSLLTKPLAVGLEKNASSSGLISISSSLGNSYNKHVENVKTKITDPKNLAMLSELSTRALLGYQNANGIRSSSVPAPSNPTSVLLTSPSSDHGSEQDVRCIRVLSSHGDLDYRPQYTYLSSLADLYKKSFGVVEFPGGTSYDLQQSDVDGAFELFPLSQHWQESDYDSLKSQSLTLLKKMPVLTLIRLAVKDLSHSLPFLQWNDIETYVSVFTLSSMTATWSSVQVRQRHSLLLLLCALGSSLTPAVNVNTHLGAPAQAALPWELGMKCFQLARGMLCPMSEQFQEEEKSLELIQCMILMNIFMTRCQDKQSVWSPLAHGDSVALHLLSKASLPSTNIDMSHFLVEREMLKRCIWMLFMLEILTRVEKDSVQTRSLWTEFPFKLEQPISIAGLSTSCGAADACITQDTLERFISQTQLCQIMVSVLLLRLHEPVTRTEEVNEVVRALQRELSKWVSHTPCLLRTGTSTTTTPLAETWQPPSVIPFPALYEACSVYLARAAV